MGNLYNCFQTNSVTQNLSVDKVKIVCFEYEGRRYEIFFTKKRANKYSIIHCRDNTIEWEQFPLLPKISGRNYGIKEAIIRLVPQKDIVRIFVIKGKPNSIIGLDEVVFRSVHRYDEKYINVMSEARFKEM